MRAGVTAVLLGLALVWGSCAGAEAGADGFAEPVDWEARAAAAEAARSWEEAAFALDRMPAARDPDEDWLRRRVRAAEGAGDSAAAVRYREPLLRAHPDDLLLHVDQADDLQRIGRTEEALVLLDPFLAAEGQRLAALRARAVLLERDGRPAAAAAALEEAAGLAESEAARGLWQRASRLREAAGDRAGALADVERALAGVDLRPEERRMQQWLQAWESGRPENVADAVTLLRHHPDPAYRFRAIRALAGRAFPDAVAVFREALADPDPAVRAVAIRELGRRGGPEELPDVLPLLQAGDLRVFQAAVRAIGSLGGEAEVPALLQVFTAEDRARFRAVRAALEALTDQVIGLDLDPGPERRREIVAEWRQWWASGPGAASPQEGQPKGGVER